MLPPFGPLVAVEIAWPSDGATPKQPIIGCERQREVAKRLGRFGEPHRPASAVDPPFRVVALRQPRDRTWVDDIRGERGEGPAGGPVRRHAVDADGERVAGLGAVNEERSRHRVRAIGRLLAVAVIAPGIERIGDDRVAIGDVEHRLGAADGVVEACRREAVRGQGVRSC